MFEENLYKYSELYLRNYYIFKVKPFLYLQKLPDIYICKINSNKVITPKTYANNKCQVRNGENLFIFYLFTEF